MTKLIIFLGALIILFLVILPRYDREIPLPQGQLVPDRNGKLILDGLQAPIGPQLQEFLTRGGYLALTLTNAIGQVKIVGRDGKQIEPCGQLRGTRITGKCDLEDFTLEHINQVLILDTDECTTQRIGRFLVQYSNDAAKLRKCPPQDAQGSTANAPAQEGAPIETSAQQPPPPSDKPIYANTELIQDKVQVPLGPQLQEFLTRGGYLALTLINATGQVKIVGRDGVQIEPCGQVERTQIIGKCNRNFAMADLSNGRAHDFLEVPTAYAQEGPSEELGENEVTIMASTTKCDCIFFEGEHQWRHAREGRSSYQKCKCNPSGPDGGHQHKSCPGDAVGNALCSGNSASATTTNTTIFVGSNIIQPSP